MASITISFNFSDESSTTEDFDADSGLLTTIADFGVETAESLTEDLADEEGCEVEIEFEGWEVESTDLDHSDQQDHDDFTDLDAWGEYCEEVDKHGEAYCLRYADIGDHDFEDEYNGCWGSEEEFAEHFVDDCMEVPSSMAMYFDYEKFARDLMMDYSSYDGSEGCHIFRA